jgi:hypothetical protein
MKKIVFNEQLPHFNETYSITKILELEFEGNADVPKINTKLIINSIVYNVLEIKEIKQFNAIIILLTKIKA